MGSTAIKIAKALRKLLNGVRRIGIGYSFASILIRHDAKLRNLLAFTDQFPFDIDISRKKVEIIHFLPAKFTFVETCSGHITKLVEVS